ncbi:MAG: helix-turn-helix domain-containing protein [Rikenellaceae bacterium]
MRIIQIEERVWNQILEKIELLSEKVAQLCRLSRDKGLQKWLDNQDVCEILNITPRTLQSYRDSGKIGFSQQHHKVLYSPEDVERFIQSQKHN